ncbi:MAG: hypothetical protein Q7R48_02250 [bacterium]|nr:hypothetical protein [bacterium]
MVTKYTKIILPAKPQPDTIVGTFLLRKFGGAKYPGIEDAELKVMSMLPESVESMEQQGAMLVDIGKGKFDHHGTQKTVSQQIAEDLGVDQDPALQRLLQYAERDDKHGMGTISKDSIDRAFGLSGLISSLTRSMPNDPQRVVEIIMPLLEAHYVEQEKWFQELPKEFSTRLNEGKAGVHRVLQKGKSLKVISIESDGQSMAAYLRSHAGQKADVVIQRSSSGHVNIVTLQQKKIDLRMAAGLMRFEESKMRNRTIAVKPEELMKPGRIEEVPEWYYDTATNSLLNGGLHPQGTEGTAIPFVKLKEILLEGLGGV